MKPYLTAAQRRTFCQTYLRTLDPDRSASRAGIRDGWAALHDESVRTELERLRGDSRDQILREDAVRRLAELAFGQANDATALAFAGPDGNPAVHGLDLSAVSELKVTDKGVEVKFLDRVRALESLCELLSDRDDGAAAFFQALGSTGDCETEP